MSLNPQRAHDRKLKQLHASPRRARCKGVISTAGSGSRVKLDYIALCRIRLSILDGRGGTLGQCNSPLQCPACLLCVHPSVCGDMAPTLTLLCCVGGTSRYAHRRRIGSCSPTLSALSSLLMSWLCWTVSPPHQGEFIWASVALRVHPTLFLFFFSPFFCVLLHPPLSAAVKVEASRVMNEPGMCKRRHLKSERR